MLDRLVRGCKTVSEDQLTLNMTVGYSIQKDGCDSLQNVLCKAEDVMYRNKVMSAKSSRNSIVASLRITLQEKSHEIEDHCRRLEEISLAIGREVGLKKAELDDLALLAVLHDIGKVAIPESILNKPGKFTGRVGDHELVIA